VFLIFLYSILFKKEFIMGITDTSPNAAATPTDAVATAKVLRNLIRSVQNCRQTVNRIT
jgi:hypothetical protein